MTRPPPREDPPAATKLARVDPLATLRHLGAAETLESIYALWAELRGDHGQQHSARVREQARLQGEGSFLLGAVRAAGTLGEPASSSSSLVRPGGREIDGFLAEAEARLKQARSELEGREREEEQGFVDAFLAIEQTLEERIQSYAARAPPSLVVWRRPLGKDRAVLHLERLSRDDSVVLLYVSIGKVAARHDFLLDDSTDAPDLPPTLFFPDLGVRTEDLRPSATRFPELSRPSGRVSPVKTFLPVFVSRPDGQEIFYRLLQRGQVLEAEIMDGGGFRSALTGPEAELLAGQLLRWKLSGSIQLRLEMG